MSVVPTPRCDGVSDVGGCDVVEGILERNECLGICCPRNPHGPSQEMHDCPRHFTSRFLGLVLGFCTGRQSGHILSPCVGCFFFFFLCSQAHSLRVSVVVSVCVWSQMVFKKLVVVDGRGHLLGRMASTVAKELLSGQKVVC